MNSQMERYRGQGLERSRVQELQLPYIIVHQPGSSCKPCCSEFLKSLQRHDWLNHWLLVSTRNLQPFSPPQRLGVGLKSLTF